MVVLCEDKSGLEDEAQYCSGKLSVEGRVFYLFENYFIYSFNLGSKASRMSTAKFNSLYENENPSN